MLEPIINGSAAVPARVAANMANTIPNIAAVVVPAIMLQNILLVEWSLSRLQGVNLELRVKVKVRCVQKPWAVI
jgi:hypothetical protein